VNKKIQAFTLTEILIVVILMGIIAAFAVPNFDKSQSSAQEKNIVSQLKILHAANFAYFGKEGTYYFTDGNPTTLPNTNVVLGIKLMTNDTQFSYTGISPVSYYATMGWLHGDGTPDWTVRIQHGALSSTNPCCHGGPCPTLNGCGAVPGPECGDQVCNGGENCGSCAVDCYCASCGDGIVDTAAGEVCDPPGSTQLCDGGDGDPIGSSQSCNFFCSWFPCLPIGGSGCGNGTCDYDDDECANGCSDCTLADCCRSSPADAAFCSGAMGETCTTCPLNCGAC